MGSRWRKPVLESSRLSETEREHYPKNANKLCEDVNYFPPTHPIRENHFQKDHVHTKFELDQTKTYWENAAAILTSYPLTSAMAESIYSEIIETVSVFRKINDGVIYYRPLNNKNKEGRNHPELWFWSRLSANTRPGLIICLSRHRREERTKRKLNLHAHL